MSRNTFVACNNPGVSSTLAQDYAFAAELAPSWSRRSRAEQHALLLQWTKRATCLLARLCRREGLDVEADRIDALAVTDASVRADIRTLEVLALGIEHHRATPRSEGVALMAWATRWCAQLASEHDEDEDGLESTRRFAKMCVRLRWLARATRSLDEETRLMFQDLADA